MEKFYEPISNDDILTIANKYYDEKQHLTEWKKRPKAIFIAGQSGAGKTKAANLVKVELKNIGGYIPVDADRMREELPTGGIAYPSEQTQDDAAKLVKELRDRIVSEKRNFFEEGTFRNSEAVKQAVNALKIYEYQTEMVAVATNFEQSLLGIYERFERQINSGASNPRLVPADYHQNAFDGFTNMFQENANLFDRVRVVNRSGQELFDSQKHDNKTAYEALLSGRKLSVQDLKDIQTGWERVIESAKQRGNEAEQYMSSIVAHKNKVSAELRKELFKPERVTEKAVSEKISVQKNKPKNRF